MPEGKIGYSLLELELLTHPPALPRKPMKSVKIFSKTIVSVKKLL
jgi:hypothetical protein